MEARFELTLDDFVQALTAHGTRQRQRGEKQRSRWWIVILPPVILVVLLGLVLASAWDELRYRGYWLKEIDGSVVGAAPWTVLVLINLAQLGYSFWGRRGTMLALLTIAVVGLGMLVGISWLTAVSWGWLWIAWALVGGYWLSAWRAYIEQTGFRWLWEHDKRLQGPKTLGWDHQEFSVADADSRTSYRWESLRGWQETADLLLLYISEIVFVIVPKRAFAGERDLDEFRRAVIDSTEVRKAAFPVIPVDTSRLVQDQTND